MLNIHNFRPSSFVKKDAELRLSSADLSELLKSVLEKEYHFRFRIKGRSMYPCIRNEDVITISPISNNAVRIVDIVAFTNLKNDLVIYRVVDIRDDIFLVKGDNVYH